MRVTSGKRTSPQKRYEEGSGPWRNTVAETNITPGDGRDGEYTKKGEFKPAVTRAKKKGKRRG